MRRFMMTIIVLFIYLFMAMGVCEESIDALSFDKQISQIDLTGYRVCIDPGHQGSINNKLEPTAPLQTRTKIRVAGGAQGVATYRRESTVNLEIALLLRDALEHMGAEVLMVRETEDVNISNVQRAQMANQFQADIFLRLHCNSNSNKKARGIRIYAPKRSAKLYYNMDPDEILALAQRFADMLKESTGAPSGKAAVNDIYSGSNWAQMPAFLVEMGYMSNPEDDRLLMTDAYRQGLVIGIARFIQTIEKETYRNTQILQNPVMENHKSPSEKVKVYEAMDDQSAVITTVSKNKAIFIMDDLGDGWYYVQTYAKGKVGYIWCETLQPCK